MQWPPNASPLLSSRQEFLAHEAPEKEPQQQQQQLQLQQQDAVETEETRSSGFPIRFIKPLGPTGSAGNLTQAPAVVGDELKILQQRDVVAAASVGSSSPKMLLVVLNGFTDDPDANQFYWLFSQFGVVERLSFFEKDGRKQLLVQYSHTTQANRAMSFLSSRHVQLSGSAPTYLVVLPSNQPHLKFKSDDKRNRDFKLVNQVVLRSGWTPPAPYDFLWGVWRRGEGWLIPQQLSNLQKCYIPVSPDEGIPEGKPGSCVHISGLAGARYTMQDQQEISISLLWKVAGQYGDLVAARLLVQHSECALVQFKTQIDAGNLRKHLNRITVFGRMLSVKIGNHANATHWSGHETELKDRMRCARYDIPPPPAPHDVNAPPSERVAVWGLPQHYPHMSIVEITRATLTREQQPFLSITEEGPAQVLVTYPSADQAFLSIGTLNGIDVCDITPLPFKICMHFVKGKSKKRRGRVKDKKGAGAVVLVPPTVPLLVPQVSPDKQQKEIEDAKRKARLSLP
eukprot:TRINITY_DN943_c2_g2_i3.p1 TRINITY_DN943_c2_g2~~TRINITY_DN943_c2_g2_i3.p1  ORF type:complete len:523 (+),score=36.98 TRINITY_DN943_c2_g2_i3:34-1569(+)